MEPSIARVVALTEIAKSCSLDFDNDREWAEWCRGIAIAAMFGDTEEINHYLLDAAEGMFRRHRSLPQSTDADNN